MNFSTFIELWCMYKCLIGLSMTSVLIRGCVPLSSKSFAKLDKWVMISELGQAFSLHVLLWSWVLPDWSFSTGASQIQALYVHCKSVEDSRYPVHEWPNHPVNSFPTEPLLLICILLVEGPALSRDLSLCIHIWWIYIPRVSTNWFLNCSKQVLDEYKKFSSITNFFEYPNADGMLQIHAHLSSLVVCYYVKRNCVFFLYLHLLLYFHIFPKWTNKKCSNSVYSTTSDKRCIVYHKLEGTNQQVDSDRTAFTIACHSNLFKLC